MVKTAVGMRGRNVDQAPRLHHVRRASHDAHRQRSTGAEFASWHCIIAFA
jgi:hypothetical protein